MSLEYSMMTEHHLEFLSLTRGCIVSSESTLVKMSHCWKSRVTAKMQCHSDLIKIIAVRHIINQVNEHQCNLYETFTFS